MKCKYCEKEIDINYNDPNIHYGLEEIPNICIRCESREKLVVGKYIQLEDGEYIYY